MAARTHVVTYTRGGTRARARLGRGRVRAMVAGAAQVGVWRSTCGPEREWSGAMSLFFFLFSFFFFQRTPRASLLAHKPALIGVFSSKGSRTRARVAPGRKSKTKKYIRGWGKHALPLPHNHYWSDSF
jgi:hypothetical protein